MTCKATGISPETILELQAFTLTVVDISANPDDTPPVITVPDDITFSGFDDAINRQVLDSTPNFPPSATDDVDGYMGAPTCTTQPTVDSSFTSVPVTGVWAYLNWQVGTYTITCEATDSAGNTGSSNFQFYFQ